MKSIKHKQLLFVYNADSTVFAKATDFVHKAVSPATYQCNLCKITYGNVRMKREWKSYIDSLDHTAVFLHKKEFQNKYPKYTSAELPAIFMKDAGILQILIPASELNEIQSIKGLISILDNKLLPFKERQFK